MTNEVTEPAIQALIHAINEGDRGGFFTALTPDATMSDDGRSLIAENTNDAYGTMRTFWRFTLRDGKISRFETGQR
ncbi:MAG TPA: nuclear transport factor 2 family protein [Streptosporangiaceae bacterium]|jgi:hypothetical protein|nr:nuclear transport factor 2 family protein [Streptosporangiaceae bacterium]